jgi:hypothetical protein
LETQTLIKQNFQLALVGNSAEVAQRGEWHADETLIFQNQRKICFVTAAGDNASNSATK